LFVAFAVKKQPYKVVKMLEIRKN